MAMEWSHKHCTCPDEKRTPTADDSMRLAQGLCSGLLQGSGAEGGALREMGAAATRQAPRAASWSHEHASEAFDGGPGPRSGEDTAKKAKQACHR